MSQAADRFQRARLAVADQLRSAQVDLAVGDREHARQWVDRARRELTALAQAVGLTRKQRRRTA